MKIIIVTILAGIIVNSCNGFKKIEKSEEVKNEQKSTHNWIYGRTFIQEGAVDKNPELGGAAFLKFVSKEVIELKTGDIVTRVNANFAGDKIILEDQTLGVKRVFNIVNDTCLLENGKKWTTK